MLITSLNFILTIKLGAQKRTGSISGALSNIAAPTLAAWFSFICGFKPYIPKGHEGYNPTTERLVHVVCELVEQLLGLRELGDACSENVWLLGGAAFSSGATSAGAEFIVVLRLFRGPLPLLATSLGTRMRPGNRKAT